MNDLQIRPNRSTYLGAHRHWRKSDKKGLRKSDKKMAAALHKGSSAALKWRTQRTAAPSPSGRTAFLGRSRNRELYGFDKLGDNRATYVAQSITNAVIFDRNELGPRR
ncbi:hypothetical protein [Novosphingobium sp.]|uniref:hypothetical protein n=1 Tax=Novosphingobium sp. TaxID=1874826 RepID=UPI00261C5786|nr:hypothetical protein [Novosphingobium sp.]